MLISLWIAPLCSYFWRRSQCPNFLQVHLFERNFCLISRASEGFEFGLKFPLQNWVLPTLLPVCPKRGRKVIFEVFSTFLGAQNLSKLLVNLCECIYFHEKSKNVEFSSKGFPQQKWAPGGAAHWEEKLGFWPKISKIAKNVPNFFEIWVECSPLSAMLVHGGLKQDLKFILLFSLPWCLLQLGLQVPDSCLATFVCRKVMVGHVPQHSFFPIGLL